MIGATEINAIQGLGPNWAPLVLVVIVLAPVLTALVAREKKKPEDPLTALHGEVRALRKLTEDTAAETKALRKLAEDNADETRALRRDVDRSELRAEVLRAIKGMSEPK